MAKLRGFGEYIALLAIWALLLFYFGQQSEHFLSKSTFTTLAGRIPTLAVVAAGMTLVLIIGGIDLSVGSILGLSGALLGLALTEWHWSLPLASGLALLGGLGLGLLNGILSVHWRLPAFIATLGMLEMARGGAYLLTDSKTKYIGEAVGGLAKPISGLGLPPAFLIALAVVFACHFMLTKTVFGRQLIAIGTNENAVRLAGINPRPGKLIVFAISGLLAALGALFNTARLGASDPNAGSGLELAAIAAAVVGGTSLLGGRGSVLTSVLGVLIIATLESGLASVGASEPTKRVVTGVVIIVAVLLDLWRKKGK
jgi:ribose transport system permease protein